MMLTSKGRYAVMAMVDVTLYSKNTPVQLEKIAERQNITLNYLEQIFMKLKRGGLVNSTKGPGGGYMLAVLADQITIRSIIHAVDEPIKMTRCNSEKQDGCMHNNTRCVTHHLWEGLSDHIAGYLESITLSDICQQNLDLNASKK